MWPKKQVNKPLLKPAMFCRTLCRGQNLGILPGPFDLCLQNVWRTPTQNCRSKRCHLGAPIPIWKWTELCESYGIWWKISLLSQIIGSHFWWYLCTKFSFQPTKYSLPSTVRLRNPPTLLRIIRKSLFFFQQCSVLSNWKKNHTFLPRYPDLYWCMVVQRC